MANILPPCKLLEFDFSGIEAVTLGWFAARLTNDPMVIRFAKLGLHALVASHLVGKPPDMSRSDEELGAYFKAIKKQHPAEYEPSKRTVHGTGYGMTPEGMTLMFPDVYSSLRHAQQIQGIYFKVCPPVPAFQLDVKKRAAKANYLGGPVAPGLTLLTDMNAHPYTYDHWFWNVVDYRKLSPQQVRAWKAGRSEIKAPVIEIDGLHYAMLWGPDSKRALAFYPQSSAAGILCEAELVLFADRDHPHYIGDVYYGSTPLRAPIHDSFFIECPWRKVEHVQEAVFTEMLRPVEEMPMRPEWKMGPYLTVGVEGKIGDDWANMEEIPTPTIDYGVAWDTTFFPAEEEEEEDVIELTTRVA